MDLIMTARRGRDSREANPLARNPSSSKGDAKARLLAASLRYVGQHGLSEITLRELAARIGTSHRMLSYHFGSKQGLLIEVVRAIENQQKRRSQELEQNSQLSQLDKIREFWSGLIRPELAPYERLFFEMYSQALCKQPATSELLKDLVESWVEPFEAWGAQNGLDPAAARAEGRLTLSIVRGLLLDLLATGDRDGVQAAFDRFLEHYDSPLLSSGKQSPKGPVRRARKAAKDRVDLNRPGRR